MGARYISRSSHMPGTIQVAKCTYGAATDMDSTDTEGQVVLGTGLLVANNTTGVFPLFYIPFGTVVDNMVVRKTVAASAANLSIGDTDVDGFWPATDLLSTAVGIKNLYTQVSTAETATLPAYAPGRFYDSTGDTFDTDKMFAINAQVATAALTAGKAEVYLFYHFQSELEHK